MTKLMAGTIIKGIAGQYTVDTQQGKFVCNARGLFRKQKISPIVGDHVEIEIAVGSATLKTILPRVNELRRPKVANVDQVLVVLSTAQPDLHFTILDRYLMQAEHENIEAAVCINKLDLNADIFSKICEIYKPSGYSIYPIFATSCAKLEGLAELKSFLQNKVTVLAGPSGVGKSSIVNAITECNQKTAMVSEKIGRGKHTTRHAEFLPILPAGYVIDTPGFSSLNPPDVPIIEKAALFREFQPWLGQCRFRDCVHIMEEDCAIKEQINKSISPQRYDNYLKYVQDNEF